MHRPSNVKPRDNLFPPIIMLYKSSGNSLLPSAFVLEEKSKSFDKLSELTTLNLVLSKISGNTCITSFQDGFAGCLVKGAADRLVQSIAYDIQESPYFSDEFFDIVKDSFCFDQNGSGFTLKSEEILGQIKGPDNVMHDVVGIDTDYGPSIAFKSSIPPHSDY